MNRPFLCVAVLLGASGCEEASEFLPAVAFDGLEVRSIDWEQAAVDFVFSVKNPNPVTIGLSSFSYDLDLETISFLSGDNPDGFRLEAEGKAPLVLPLDLRYEEIWNTIAATRGEDIVDFGLSGRLGFNTPVGEAQIPYNEAGGFPALRTPKFSFKTVRLTNSNPLNPQLEIDLGVDNEHQSSLFFDNFDYGLEINGRSVADGIVNTFDIDGATQGTLTLPIRISALDVGAELINILLNNGKIDLGLKAGMDVDTPFGVVPLTIDETGLDLSVFSP